MAIFVKQKDVRTKVEKNGKQGKKPAEKRKTRSWVRIGVYIASLLTVAGATYYVIRYRSASGVKKPKPKAKVRDTGNRRRVVYEFWTSGK